MARNGLSKLALDATEQARDALSIRRNLQEKKRSNLQNKM